MIPTIIVHGGAKTITDDKVAANNAGCTAAAEAGWAVLISGGTAAEAVEAATRVLEADPTFNAGLGATLNSDGEVELDAAIMEGSLSWGAIAAVQGIRHPISVARKIMDEKPRLLVARGGERFAIDCGAEMCKKEDLVAEEQWQQWKEDQEVIDRPNTIGCVALDASGVLAAATSTGGTTKQQQGRVGDTAIVGCGLYADNKIGGCSTTGDGESIIPVVLAKTAIDFLTGDRHPDEAAQMAIDALVSKVKGEAGCILIDRQGRVGWAYNSSHMACAYMTTGQDKVAAFTKK
ncbi:isoaspartyl peptidase/L-asparaginase [Nostoc sp. UCD121]|uniref:isoaspartyl peptidase/L-asparaginase family protein n=1 Tax=unclassified Nostoc TaxID=2593658 RepID=UPI00162329A3|nr:MULTISPECIES: isoaspartyl peptidase/L-asparaginase family protein [unclassified Nostoc]MBC1220224.1 isoaspartyl peptidase/L-asparaginase [Nostoc sp. UCD120]MBC1280160.1 isoaspartyl peptidase/L-asparaginase [Nostoc sp. UCD121]MBC1294727.1 isoaspartyl peptidase/L-asparaginase [Nostoc sp. UCD122]